MYKGSVVGTTFEPAKSNIPVLVDYLQTITAEHGSIEIAVIIKHNPLNKYDSNALEVHVGYANKHFFVGHIPKTHNTQLLEYGLANLSSEVEAFYFDDTGTAFGLSITVSKKHQVFDENADKNLSNHVGV